MASQPPLAGATSPNSRTAPGLKHPTNGKTIYSRPLNRSRTGELSQASFAYLFGEMVSYAQKRVTDIQDLEKRYALSDCAPSSAGHMERGGVDWEDGS